MVPTYKGDHSYVLTMLALDAQKRVPALDLSFSQSSFLTLQFNKFWAYALNHPEYTHFVMLHADVEPKAANWLEGIIQLSDKYSADVLSAVSPLKNEWGLTSTALARVGEFGNFRRLTMREVAQLPATFCAADLTRFFGWTESKNHLLTNTGLMVVRMKKRAILETMRFTVNNWIRKVDGKFVAVSEPEDWEWSKQAQERGLSVWATRAIPLAHKGEKEYPNDSEWGTLKHDTGDAQGKF